MRSLLVVLVSLLTTEVAATVTGKLYSSAGVDDKSFTDNLVFTSPVRSLLHCALLCQQRQSCLTFTFEGEGCRGHSVKVTASTPATYSTGAQSYAVVPRKTECDSSDGGVVTIYPADNTPLQVYCDSDTDGGGWLVFQRRQDGSVNFFEDWTTYRQGFGDLNGEFWLGLDALHMLTSARSCDLRVDLMMWNGTTGYATYSNFSISDSSDNYRLHFDNFTGGNASDSLSLQNHMQFSTSDADNDMDGSMHCAEICVGAWWYAACSDCSLNAGHDGSMGYAVCCGANLNGEYYGSRMDYDDGVQWNNFDPGFSLKFTEMKLRPV